MQPTAISVGSTSLPRSGFGADLYYCPNKAATCTSNNGNLQTETLSILSVDQNFSYDSLNRLLWASESDSSWSQGYGYDNYGNRWVSTGVVMSPFTPTLSTNFDANNRLQIDGTAYDLAGNLRQIGGYTSVWDAEGRFYSSSINSPTTTYGYDGDGKRVMKQSPGETTYYLYDAFGQLSAEYATALPAADCATCYLSTDQLGSTRLVTDAGQNVIARHDYLPFGEEIPSTYGGRSKPSLLFGALDNVNQKFTGKERDAESGLDYFGARYYGSALGRWTSPDPKLFSKEALQIPQEWNKYAYARNNPLEYVDPDGQDDVAAAGCMGSAGAEACLQKQADARGNGGVLAAKGVALVGGAYLLMQAPALGRALLGWALTHPDTTQEAAAALAEGMSNAPPGSLTGNLARLSATEISTGIRFAEQEGIHLSVSSHVGEEFVDAAGKTYDAIGGGKAFEHFGDGSKFLNSLGKHVLKSVDNVIVDLKGASEEQVNTIKNYVGGLKDTQQAKIKYLQ